MVAVLPVQSAAAPVLVPVKVGVAFTVGNVAVLEPPGVNVQLGVTSVRVIPVIVIVCALLAAVSAIVLKLAEPPTPVTLAVCVPAVPPTV